MKARGPMRWTKRGSSMGKDRPSKVISAANPLDGSTISFSFTSGSITSMRIGPHDMSMRSMFRKREACRQCSTPSRITEKWASQMFTCG